MKINIKGVVVPNDDKWIYDWLEYEAVCPNDVSKALAEAKGEDLEVEINSGGGDVYAGSEIYTALKSYKGQVLVKIVGVAASAASVIAMAGDLIAISPTAQIMIHNVRTRGEGDYRDFQHNADVLKGWNESIANAYILKTGLKLDELLALMDETSWLTAKQAKEKGFADEIMFDEVGRLAAGSNMLPPEVVNKIRNHLLDQKMSNEKQTSLQLQARLKFLKLKGER